MAKNWLKKGGTIPNTRENVAIPNLPVKKAKSGGKNWIQKAVNPEHKGYCTPMTKSTCTPKRKALAQTFKKMAKKHEEGGKVGDPINPKYKFDPTLPKVKEEKKGGRLSKEYIKKAHEKPGGSNVGKKEFASGAKRTGPYVGPSGGAPKGSYPIPDVKHAKAALSLAHNAPDPAGIKAAVYKKFPALKHQRGGTVGEGPKEGDTAAVYKKGSKVGKKQVGGAMGSGAAAYGAAKKGAKLPEKKGKIDSSKWKK